MAILAKKMEFAHQTVPYWCSLCEAWGRLKAPVMHAYSCACRMLWRSCGTAKTLSWLRRSILFYTPPLKKKPNVKITISTAAKPLITILPILVLTMALWSFLIFS